MQDWLSIIISWLPLLILVAGMIFFGLQLVRLGKILERITQALENKHDVK
jgi:hypothetical protein